MTALPASPTVTVAIAAYNARDHIAAAVATALGQTRRDLEVIVVDDCSDDGTLDMLAPLAARDPRLRLERMERNGGPAAARNRSLDLARGTWFAVLDADDLFASDRIERLLAVAEGESADLIADDLVVFDHGDPASARRHLGDGQEPRWLELNEYLANARLFAPGFDPGFLKPMIALPRLRAAGLRYDESLRVGEDDDLVVRMLLAGLRYRLEPVPLYAYRKHPGSISHRLSPAAARAMVAAGTAVAAAHAGNAAGAALARRAAAFRRGLAFAELISALKSRDARRCLAIARRQPDALPLLRMPLAARLAKNFARQSPTEDHEARAALATIFTAADTDER